MIKLVAIDIDGTLVNEQKVLTQRVQDAIHQAIDQGVKIVLCTGRPIEGIRPYLDQLGFADEEDYVISQNGAAITRVDTMEVVDHVPLSLEEVTELYEFGKNYPADICLLNEERFYMVLPYGAEPRIEEDLIDEGRTINMEVEIIHLDHLDEKEEILKMVYFGDPNEVDVVEQAMSPEWHDRYYIVRSQDYLIEVMVKDTNKGTALKKLADHLGFSMDEVMAIGDGENDYEMIEAAGLGVVMENGTERLKGIANELTLSNEADGVAHAFRKWVLK
ncbi:Cof-type HAD-IIB family hydrolase [Jeotgalibaca caeni]|uniref:Cof-type HAD-IIB family hydrolase n=1 Tax=Jeotgalibaca caeni TaxID=3028623 RepID=UPI00237E27C6|nr:Cof-type HAD-IIB family hydrolase [Jeotgalibaca caeni]MDE1548188.1 Cof-type HAD-IIB family hydrolase [Jeotgalibaca caeni]